MNLQWVMRLGAAAFVALGGGGACSGGCADDQPPPTKMASVVARLSVASGEVSHRGAQTLRWRAAAKGIDLRHRDAIKTGSGSGAVVAFLQGGKLDIGEQALVVIEAPATETAPPGSHAAGAAQRPVVNVQRGVVRGRVEPGASLTVRTADGRQARIVAGGTEAATFRVSVKQGGRLEVAVLKGGARVDVGGKSARLKGGELVDVVGKRVSQPTRLLPYPELVAPAVDARLHAGARLQLAWKPVPGAALYRVQVSRSLGFEQRDVDSKLTVAEFVLPELRPQKMYVWRVSSIDASGHEGEFGFARRFHVLSTSEEQAGLLSPPNNAGIQYVKQIKPITFRWKGAAERFELVVSRGRRLARAVVRRRTRAHSLTISDLKRGVYYWGVYSLGAEGQRRALVGKPHRLVIARRLPPGVQVPKSIDWK